MTINVINGGEQAFRAMVYRQPDNNLMQYLNNSMSEAAAVVGNASASFINGVKDVYERFNGSNVLNAAKAMLMTAGSHVNQDVIYYIPKNNIQDANLMMQSYIMCHPGVQRVYSKNMCHGYAETYYDMEPNTYGKDRYDYQRVMDGMMFIEDGETNLIAYSNGDKIAELDIYQKLSIMDTWDNVSLLMLEGKDPTDSSR